MKAKYIKKLKQSSKPKSAWHVKVRGVDGYHPLLGMKDLGLNNGNNYIVHGMGPIHQRYIEDMRPSTEVDNLEKAKKKSTQVSLVTGSNKLREVRDLLDQHGGKLHAKDMITLGKHPEQYGINHLKDSQGVISSEAVDKHIQSLPKVTFNVSHEVHSSGSDHEKYMDPSHPLHEQYKQYYEQNPAYANANLQSGQHHSEEPSQVFQLNATPEHKKKMKEAGVLDTFNNLNKLSHDSNHPVAKEHGIGWVRYTEGPDGVHVDEIQSDLSNSVVRQAKQQAEMAKQMGVIDDSTAQATVARAERAFPDEHVNKINEILFGEKKPPEILHEAFLQHLRDNGKAGQQIHMWQAKPKAEIAGLDINQQLPGHMQFTYDQLPQKSGYKQGEYGELQTQSGAEHKGKKTWKAPLRKEETFNYLIEQLVKSRKKDFANQLASHPEANHIAEFASKLPGDWGHFLVRHVKQDPTKWNSKNQETLSHMSGMTHLNDIKNYRFGNQDFDTGMNNLTALEQKAIQPKVDQDRLVTPKGKKMIDLGNGMGWWNLGVSSCDQEAKSMGHCGNVPSAYLGDRVLSLRTEHQTSDGTMHEPHLTFIENNGYLGEMKGRGNTKPAPKYHNHITALLKHPEIQGIVGGGYKPEANFQFSDLKPETQAEIKSQKPNIASPNILHLPSKFHRDYTLPNEVQGISAFNTDELNSIVRSNNPNGPIHSYLAKNPSTPPEILHKLFESSKPDSTVYRYLAENSNTPPELLHKLFASDNPNSAVHHSLSENPNTPPELLHKLFTAKGLGHDIRHNIAKNPSTPPEILHKLFASRKQNKFVNEYLGENPNLPPELMHKIFEANKLDSTQLYSLSSNPSTPPELMHKLFAYSKPGSLVYNSLAENPNTPPELMHTIFASSNPGSIVHQFLAENRNTPPELMHKLFESNKPEDDPEDDPHSIVHGLLAENPSTPPELKAKLQQEGHEIHKPNDLRLKSLDELNVLKHSHNHEVAKEARRMLEEKQLLNVNKPNKKITKAEDLYELISHDIIIEDLEKADEPPAKVGEKHPYKPYVGKKHTTGIVTWYYNPEKSKEIDDYVAQNKESYISKHPAEHQPIVRAFIDKSMGSYTRHAVAGWDSKDRKAAIRARHIKGLIAGNPDYQMVVHNPDKLTFTAARHGDQWKNSNWSFNAKDLQKNISKNAKVFSDSADKGIVTNNGGSHETVENERNSGRTNDRLGMELRKGPASDQPMGTDASRIRSRNKALRSSRFSRKAGGNSKPSEALQHNSGVVKDPYKVSQYNTSNSVVKDPYKTHSYFTNKLNGLHKGQLDPKELATGTKIEEEHKGTIKQIMTDAKAGKLKPLKHYYTNIAKDHLKEISDYYHRLVAMEQKAKKAGANSEK